MVGVMVKRRGLDYWSKVVADFEAGNGRETHEEFAARRRLNRTTFQKWLYRIRMGRRVPSARAVRLLPVEVVGSSTGDRSILVELGGKLALRFAVGTDPAYVAALVTAFPSC